jgi:hypothetical protein
MRIYRKARLRQPTASLGSWIRSAGWRFSFDRTVLWLFEVVFACVNGGTEFRSDHDVDTSAFPLLFWPAEAVRDAYWSMQIFKLFLTIRAFNISTGDTPMRNIVRINTIVFATVEDSDAMLKDCSWCRQHGHGQVFADRKAECSHWLSTPSSISESRPRSRQGLMFRNFGETEKSGVTAAWHWHGHDMLCDIWSF